MIAVTRIPGQRSRSEQLTHATGVVLPASACSRTVVFPKPAPRREDHVARVEGVRDARREARPWDRPPLVILALVYHQLPPLGDLMPDGEERERAGSALLGLRGQDRGAARGLLTAAQHAEGLHSSTCPHPSPAGLRGRGDRPTGRMPVGTHVVLRRPVEQVEPVPEQRQLLARVMRLLRRARVHRGGFVGKSVLRQVLGAARDSGARVTSARSR